MKSVKGTLWLVGLLCVPALASAQTVTEVSVAEVEEESPWSADISLNQDAFFGFYPFMAGSYAISDLMDFTFYSIIWTTPSFSTGAFADSNPNGGGLWTEVGLGVNFKFLDDAISVNPQLGMLNGTLLSGAGTALAGEGIVPNLTVDYDGDHVEAEFYFGYYLALRGESDAKSDFIHYWTFAGFKPLAFGGGPAADLLTIGAHWEQLRYQRVPGGADASNIYRWIGPYVKFALPVGVSLRFGAGWDLESDNGGPDFYKASVGFSF
jgi:hypothetical protein